MLPIAAQHVRSSTEERACSALSDAPIRHATPVSAGRRKTSSPARDRLAAALRRAADRLEPTTS
jgi:hypothetical protein